jgi:hypothetical protein
MYYFLQNTSGLHHTLMQALRLHFKRDLPRIMQTSATREVLLISGGQWPNASSLPKASSSVPCEASSQDEFKCVLIYALRQFQLRSKKLKWETQSQRWHHGMRMLQQSW